MAQRLIPTGSWGQVDFTAVESVRTNCLDACVAVLTYSGEQRTGSLAHLTIDSNLQIYFDWLNCTVHSIGTKVYLVGGTDRPLPAINFPTLQLDIQTWFSGKINSSGLVNEIESYLAARRYAVTNRDLLGTKMRNVTLYGNGRVQVELTNYPFKEAELLDL